MKGERVDSRLGYNEAKYLAAKALQCTTIGVMARAIKAGVCAFR